MGGGRLFVLNRLSNTVSSIDIQEGVVYAEVPAGSHDPTPEVVKRGRGFLYDTRLSGNGTNSCASCHIDGDRDGLGWDLGDPGGDMVFIEGENRVNHDTAGNEQAPVRELRELHPMKLPEGDSDTARDADRSDRRRRPAGPGWDLDEGTAVPLARGQEDAGRF